MGKQQPVGPDANGQTVAHPKKTPYVWPQEGCFAICVNELDVEIAILQEVVYISLCALF